MKFLSGEYNTSLVISQQWFRQWLGAVKQQAITWANVDPDLWRHMASLCHNGLTYILQITYYMWYEFVPVMAWCPLDNKPLTEPIMPKIKCSKSDRMCINSNWKYVEYCNKKCTQVVWLTFLYETVDDFGIHDLQFWNMFINITIRRRVLYGWIVRCVLGEH